MAHILNTIMGTTTVQNVIRDAEGVEHTVEEAVPILREVTFMIDKSTPHTLKFLDKGTEIVDGDKTKRVVGDEQTPHHVFSDAESAIAAYLDGKV